MTLKSILEEHRRIADGTAPNCYSTNELCDIILRQAKTIELLLYYIDGQSSYEIAQERAIQLLTGGEK